MVAGRKLVGRQGKEGGVDPAVLPAVTSQHLDTFHTDGESPLETRGTQHG